MGRVTATVRKGLIAAVLLAVLLLGAPGAAGAAPFTLAQTLSGTGESGAGMFGTSVAVSSDGSTAVIGAPLDGSGDGAAFVFTRSGSTWTQDGPKLTGAGELGAGHFGAAVAISADGTIILVGAPADSSGAGAVWAFSRSGSTVSQAGAPLRGTGETGAGEFGTAVALSTAGDAALVGGPGDDAGTGAVWAFGRTGEEWTPQGGKLVSSHSAAGAQAGSAVAIAAGGGRALVGAPTPDGEGAVYTFTREGESWSEGPALAAPAGESSLDRFGASVALSGEGTTALVGAPGTTVPQLEPHEETEERGVAWTYQWNGSGWSLSEELEAERGGEEVYFGEAVALSADGRTGLVAEPGWGRAQVFRHEPNGWWKRGTDLLGEASVALSGDASLAFTGEPRAPSLTRTGLVSAWELFFGPFVHTGISASELSSTSAVVHAKVDPEGSEVTECVAEYGTSSFTAHAPCTPLPGAGNSLVEVTAHLEGLAPGTKYRYRFRAASAAGAETGSVWSLTTLAPAPVASTGAATQVGETTATLSGTVNPNGLQVSDCRFEYGTSEAYGSTVACSGEPGAGNSAQPVSADLTGLTPGQSYHYRLRATNSYGTGYGQDAEFEAAPAALPEFGVCSPSSGRTGSYSDKGCVKTVAGGNGEFGWQPWPAGPGGAGGSAAGPITFETAARRRLRCTQGALAGHLSGPQSAEQSLTLSGCEASGLAGTVCSSGSTAGEVRFEALAGRLGIITAGSKPDVGWRLSPLNGAVLASFTCGGTHYSLSGAVIASLKPINKPSGSFKLTFKGKRGVQAPGAFEGQPAGALTLSGPGSDEAASLSAHVSFGEGGGVEVKANA